MELKKYFPSKGKDIFTVMLLLLVTGVFYLPVFADMGKLFTSVNWYEKYCFLFASRNTLLGFHQFPFRSPMIGGGYPTIGHPYDDSLNPLFIFTLVFGEETGIRLTVFSIFILGALGMFYLTRHVLHYNRLGAFFSAATFILCSNGACHFSQGHLEKLYLYFLPWVLAFFIKSKNDPRFIVATCLVLSLFLIKGVIIVSILVFLFLVACFYSVGTTDRGIRVDLSHLWIFLAVVCLTAGLCAPKIISFLELFAQKNQFLHWPNEGSYAAISRLTAEQGRLLSLHRLYEGLLVSDAYFNRAGNFSQMYLGPIPVALFFLSALAYWRRAIRFFAVMVIFIVIASGSNSPLDLFKWIWHLNPLAHSIWKLDDAFLIYIFSIICMISGGAFSILDRMKKYNRFYLYAALGLIFLSVSHMFFANQRYLFHPDIQLSKPQFGQEIPRLIPVKDFFQVQENYAEKTKEDYFYLKSGVGVTNFQQDLIVRIGHYAIPKYFVNKGDYAHIFEPQGRLEPNPQYRGEAFFLEPENQAQMRRFSPNEIIVGAVVKKPGQLLINQNYHENWKTALGRLESYQGLLSVYLNKEGAYDIILQYIPLGFYFGLVLSLLTIACFWIVLKFSGKIQRYLNPAKSV